MPQATLWFAHGWAYDASFWAPLRAALSDWPRWPTTPAISAPPPAGSLRPGDRHRPFAGRAAPVAPAAAGCAGLVCINGFARFGAGPDFPEGVAPRLLDRMLRQLVAQPQAVLRDFRARCGDDTPSGAPDMAALERGLLALRDEDRRAGLAALPMPALALAGAEDPVVPPAMTGAALPGVALRWHARGGHLLPRSTRSGAPDTSATSRSAWPASEPDMNGRDNAARARIGPLGCPERPRTRTPLDRRGTDFPGREIAARCYRKAACATPQARRGAALRLAAGRRPERGAGPAGRAAGAGRPSGHRHAGRGHLRRMACRPRPRRPGRRHAGLSRARRHPSGHGQSGRCRARRTAGTTAS